MSGKSAMVLETVMPIFPIVDLLILMACTSLFGAFTLKAIKVTTSYHPSVLGMGSADLVTVAAVLLLFALTLTARTWLRKQSAAGATARERAAETLDAYSVLQAEVRRADGDHPFEEEDDLGRPGPTSIRRPAPPSGKEAGRGRSQVV